MNFAPLTSLPREALQRLAGSDAESACEPLERKLAGIVAVAAIVAGVVVGLLLS